MLHTCIRRRGLPLVAMLFVLLLPSVAGAVGNIEGVTPQALPDFDTRDAVAPTADQLAAADALGATVSWSQFGTPASVIRLGGVLGTVAGRPAKVVRIVLRVRRAPRRVPTP